MDENIRTKVEEYGNTHTPQETQERFPFYPVKGILEQAQAKRAEQAQVEQGAANIITLKMYAEAGGAFYSYDGLDRDGNRIQCRGKIKSREQAVKIAQRTAERCNQFQAHLIFEHGRPIMAENEEIVNFSDTIEEIGDFCLSVAALAAVEAELQQARYQSEWDGMKRDWNGS